MNIISAGLSDIGRTRKSNQDAIHVGAPDRFFVVADGMGGHNGGDIASQMAVKLLPEFFMPKDVTTDASEQDIRKRFQESIEKVNNAIHKHAAEHEELRGMGTTIAAIFFHGPLLHVANVGDSRIYLFSRGQLFQLSRDHSMVQEKVNLGMITREEARKEPMKNVLVRSVGFLDSVEPDIFSYQIMKNDIFLICSDGLHGKVSERDILHIINRDLNVSASPSTPVTEAIVKKTAKDLIDLANHNGGQDNISVIVAVAVQ